MSDEQQPRWYSVQYDGGEASAFGYIDWEGKPYAGIAALVFQDGEWIDPSGIFSSIKVVQRDGGGSSVEVDWQLPTSASPDNLLSLAFRAPVDLTRPLPLDQFSAADSFLQVSVFGNPVGTSKVSALTAAPPPSA